METRSQTERGCVCVVAKGKGKGCGEVTGLGQAPYLVRPQWTAGDLLNGQGLLQLGAQRRAVVAARARPGPPATRYKGRVTPRSNARHCLLGSGECRVRTCRATRQRSSVPKATTPWPREGSRGREGVGAGPEGGRRAPPEGGNSGRGGSASGGRTRARRAAAATRPRPAHRRAPCVPAPAPASLG